MVMVTVKGLTYYINKEHRDNLDFLKKCVRRKWDGILIYDGMEGSGKTTLAKRDLYYLSEGKLSLETTVFTPDEFEAVIKNPNLKPFTAILWDEFVFAGLSTEAMSQMQNTIIKYLTTIRKKQLFIGLVIPYFHMLRPYFAVARSRCLIHVYSPDGLSRGAFKFYSHVQKRWLYFKNKKYYSYHGVMADYAADFSHVHYVDGQKMDKDFIYSDDEYDLKKESSIQNINKEKENTKLKPVMNQRDKMIKYFVKQGVTQSEVAKVCGVSKQLISDIVNFKSTTEG